MTDLLKRQAQWLLEVNDVKAAAEMYWAAKEYTIAITIMGDNNWLDLLMDKVRENRTGDDMRVNHDDVFATHVCIHMHTQMYAVRTLVYV